MQQFSLMKELFKCCPDRPLFSAADDGDLKLFICTFCNTLLLITLKTVRFATPCC
jgi:hypothetical protein